MSSQILPDFREAHTLKTHSFFGIQVNALTIADLNALIGTAIQQRQRWVIGNHNLHSIYLHHRHAKMRRFYEIADFIHVDGMILVLLGRLFKVPLTRDHRVTYADWTPCLMAEAAAQGWRVFYLGSKPGVAQAGAEILQRQYPTLQITTHHGYFDAQPNSADNQAILAAIADYRPHVLMVGMSMPRQEHWILENLEQISAHVILPSGAAIDYVAGAVPTPPRWAGRLGLEWLFRLIAEPRRLWQRYLLEPLFLAYWFLKHGHAQGDRAPIE
jgi:N-acetylglucosaminyldiphosphoundecaprenol N-acetyl-beta-D-mannosaminyltransferase